MLLQCKSIAYAKGLSGVDNVEKAEELVETVVYDLQGRRVNATRGIYIINGKKVVKR